MALALGARICRRDEVVRQVNRMGGRYHTMVGLKRDRMLPPILAR